MVTLNPIDSSATVCRIAGSWFLNLQFPMRRFNARSPAAETRSAVENSIQDRDLVDLDGFEPSTSSMPWKRAPNCATGPRLQVLRPENSTAKYYSTRTWVISVVPELLLRKGIDSGPDPAHNQTVGSFPSGSREDLGFSPTRMNNAVPHTSVPSKDIPFETGEFQRDRKTGVDPAHMEDLAHELRQPLSTIESLAYFLEITAVDDQTCRHLQQIRLLVHRASRILDHACIV